MLSCHHLVETPFSKPVFDVIATGVPQDWQLYKIAAADTRQTQRLWRRCILQKVQPLLERVSKRERLPNSANQQGTNTPEEEVEQADIIEDN